MYNSFCYFESGQGFLNVLFHFYISGATRNGGKIIIKQFRILFKFVEINLKFK